MNIAGGAGTLVGVASLYFLLAGEISGGEAIASLVVIVIALFYAAALANTRSVPMQLGLRGVATLGRSLIGVVPEMARVGRALVRAIGGGPAGVQGTVVHVPFRFGALTAEDIGRRAAVVTAVSLAPNGIALGMDHEADELIVHQLVPQPIGGDREWPG